MGGPLEVEIPYAREDLLSALQQEWCPEAVRFGDSTVTAHFQPEDLPAVLLPFVTSGEEDEEVQPKEGASMTYRGESQAPVQLGSLGLGALLGSDEQALRLASMWAAHCARS